MAERPRKTSMFTFNSPKIVENPQRRISLFHLQQVAGNAISSVFNNNKDQNIDELTAGGGGNPLMKTLLIIDSNPENQWQV